MATPKTHWVTVDSEGEGVTLCGKPADVFRSERLSRWPDETTCFHCRCALRVQGLIKSRRSSS